MRTTSYKWWCYSGHENTPDARNCSTCGRQRYERHAQVHASERAVVYINPATGERRTPARADQPVPEIYTQQGFERVEIMNMTKFERDTGLVHEATNFNPGCEPSPDREVVPKVSKEAREALIKDVAAAIASGPWTGGENIQ